MRVLEGEASRGATTRLGRYTVYGELASGGMATVHLGRLTGPGGFSRAVAIKRLHPQFARDPDFVEMLLDEARLAACIVHPNVVPTLDVATADGEVFLVMEYVRGISLAQIARALRPAAGRIPLRVAMAIMTGVLRGLHAAHEATDDRGAPLDIVHRDVSPQNVLVGVDGVARVLDFGIAKAVGRLHTTQDGRIKGKLAYMAPEQLCAGAITRRTDVYAASIVMWELVTGERLFGTDSGEGIIGQVLGADVRAPGTVVAGVPRDVDEILARGLHREASQRFATAREMAEAIERRLEVAPAADVADWLRAAAAEPLHAHSERVLAIGRGAGGEETELRAALDAGPTTLDASVAGPKPAAPSRARGRAIVLAGVGIVGVAAVLGVAVRSGARRTTEASRASAPASAVPATDPSDAAPPVAAAAASSAPPALPSGAPAVVAAPAVRPRRPSAVSSAHGRTCAPYTIDPQGHKVFNAACL